VKNYQQRDWLIEHYVNQGLSVKACAELSGYPITGTAVHGWLRRHSIPTRPKNSHLKGNRNPRLGMRYSEETRAIISKALTGKKLSPEACRARSERMKGANNRLYGKPRTHGKITWVVAQEGGEPLCMRSRWEVYFADWLSHEGKEWIYEPQTFILPDGSAYTPDFLSDGAYYEIKGWLSERAAEKINLFRQAFPERPLVVLGGADLLALGINIRDRSLSLSHLVVTGPKMRACEYCDTSFMPAKKQARFCSVLCSNRHRRQDPKLRSTMACAVCEMVIEVDSSALKTYPSRPQPQLTCSVACGRVLGARKRSGANHWSRRKRA